MAITRITSPAITSVASTAISGTLPAANINNTSIGNVTALPAGVGGKVLQVVQGATTTETSSSSATFADTSLTANITPSSTSNKILILVEHSRCFKQEGTQIGLKLFRDSSEIYTLRYMQDTNDTTRQINSISFNFLENAPSTSQLTYKTQFNNEQATGAILVQQSNAKSTITLMEIAG